MYCYAMYRGLLRYVQGSSCPMFYSQLLTPHIQNPMRIAIPVATTIDIPYNQRSAPAYASAVTRSGGDPIPIDLTLPPSEILALAATCDGILLPGSPADVDPALYGQPRDPATARADAPREAADYLLLDHAAATGKPILAICFGLQSLNVWSGGSLLQDLTPLPVNHEAGSSVAIAHTILVAPESLFATLLTPEEAPISGDFLRLAINTSHHQAVAAPGENLRIVARCPDDGVIEALELAPTAKLFHVEHLLTAPGPLPNPTEIIPLEPPIPGSELFHVEHLPIPAEASEGQASQSKTDLKLFHVEHSHPQFVLAVQWHPERSYDISPASRAIFDRLILEARKFQALGLEVLRPLPLGTPRL
jgi:putative glutamine amidotransferase